ncbi:PD-(D/E)XK nuclease domain-containing protein [Aquimarina rubra]
MNKQKNTILINSLNVRLRRIKLLGDLLKTSNDKINVLNFYKEVSFFYHYLWENPETRSILGKLFNFHHDLDKNSDFINFKNNSKNIIKSIVDTLLSESKSKLANLPVKNFRGTNEISAIQCLNKLRNEEFLGNSSLKSTFDDVFISLRDIIGKIEPNLNSQLHQKLNSFCSNLTEIDFYLTYKYEYHYGDSMRKLKDIYEIFCPNYRNTSATDYLGYNILFENKFLNSQNKVFETINDCDKILTHIQDKLETTESIEMVLQRFANYMTLYYDFEIKNKSKAEKHFQRRFEEFVFLSGYYPISEAQINNGRIDNLILTEKNSFLCELKQLNLGSTKSTDESFLRKIQSAKIQSQVYQERLVEINSFSKYVYIIIFTDRRTKIINKSNVIVKDDINFVFKFIHIHKETPSTIHSEIKIDLIDLFK